MTVGELKKILHDIDDDVEVRAADGGSVITRIRLELNESDKNGAIYI